MPTSGTIAQTMVSVETILSHAFARCGKLSTMVSGELLAKGREALYIVLSDFTNEGISLWCINKAVLNVVPNQAAYQLPVGTNDITNMLYRTLRLLDGVVTYAPGEAVVDLVVPSAVDNVSGLFATDGQMAFDVGYSENGTDWAPLAQLNEVDVTEGSKFSIDLDNTAVARYWRVRDWSGSATPADMGGVRFRKIHDELTMSQLNRDDYVNLPNKRYPGQKALQYWFDKQIEPRVFVWPQPQNDLDQLVIWAEQQIQDPGLLTNEIAVPPRWYRAVLGAVAYQLAFIIPKSELPQGRLGELKIEADEAMKRASDGESDGSPFQLAPRIGVYTR